MLKEHFSVLLASVTISTGIGFALGQSATDPADAAAGDAAIVSELKKLNKSIGSSPFSRGSIRGLLGEMCVNDTGSQPRCGR